MAGPEDVEACRNEMLKLKSDVQGVQKTYKSHAHERIASQTKMARIVQAVQEQSDDVTLVEDVIVLSLQSEMAASRSQSKICDAPVIDPNNQPSGTTESAEEAIAVYTSQIETLTLDLKYRKALLQAEKAMVEIYGQGIRDIVGTMHQFCENSNLTGTIESLAQAIA